MILSKLNLMEIQIKYKTHIKDRLIINNINKFYKKL